MTFIAGDGPGTTQNFSIPIVDDSLVEERENFNVELSSGEFSDTATFQIIDNDGEFLDYVNYYIETESTIILYCTFALNTPQVQAK